MKKTILILFLIFCFFLPVQAEEIQFEAFSDYILLLDPDNQQIIYEQRADEPIYPASMTKMMTLIVALEQIEDHDQILTLDYEVFKGLYEANASLAGFSYNEKVSVKDCLYGLFLPSGAECTRALAIAAAGSEEEFVKLMNQKAKELGMNQTHFENTTGLHHKDHVTTLNDLSILMQYALNNEEFYEIFTTKEYTASGSIHKQLKMNSTLFKKLSKENSEWILGGKTGYTNPAGLCLASMAQKDERTLILITAHAPVSSTPYHLLDAVEIYSTAFNEMHKIQLCSTEISVTESLVKFTLPEETIQLYPDETLTLTVSNEVKEENLELRVELIESIEAPIQKNDVLGTLSIYHDNQLLGTCQLVSHDSMEASELSIFLYNAEIFIQTHWKTGLIISAALVLLLIFKKKKH